ncbi:class I SAM-dependent methyltransferase [Flavobacterium sp.]|uniref:class I SAM-dependent methyltransferase n=1 Tax=Flavobacterium sp. TaxID=239 RepID=UPI0039E69E25
MKPEENYLEYNKKLWNDKVDFHLESEFYDLPGFLSGQTSLKPIELELLDRVKGKKILHLQCHFGQDSISLSRMGAEVTGVDLSDKAIEAGRKIAADLPTDTRFLCCDIYDLPNQLDEKFDLVFTSYGTIGWLPDLDRWAKVIAHFLKPGGQLVFVEFHPFIWMFDSNYHSIEYDYFNTGAIVEMTEGTYADKNAPIKNQSVCWNHPTSEVLNSLIQNGLSIDRFDEYDYSPYPCFSGMTEPEPGKFIIKSLGNKIPMVFSLVATKK